MNFYKRHIGDYLKDTAHLSLLEHGVYARLLDVYYTREAAIPAAQAARLIGARSDEETLALRNVLCEFFECVTGSDGDVWIQDRCEREIRSAGVKPEGVTDETPRSGKAERQKRYRERRKAMFDRLSSLGVTMPFDASMDDLQDALLRATETQRVIPDAQRVTDNDASRVTDETHNVTATNSQTPDSRLQTPEEEQQQASNVGGPGMLANIASPVSRSIEIAVYLRQRGIVGANSANPNIAAWGDDVRVTNEILDAALSVVANRKLEKAPGPNYLVGIIADLLNPKPAKAANQRYDDWHKSPAGIDRKARELGMSGRGNESYDSLKERIWEELRKREQQGAAA
ncbi:MAG: DUF1376 domain-containing protein [Paraburkholderia sp.]|uniref:YdaU family protein n=1 Tax=Paraburkholderia sp. TaxID=1926495 RepID=UPI0011FE12FF|nr:YdaU family protein [Paraburkholderia sp.]TAM07232.1 MAG: DUF1376 domain-containing protein [Paraburkholderia sp.]TAM32629.1 MAG: DUF1376 domain-containing protein [Paraburkholderia sp.]